MIQASSLSSMSVKIEQLETMNNNNNNKKTFCRNFVISVSGHLVCTPCLWAVVVCVRWAPTSSSPPGRGGLSPWPDPPSQLRQVFYSAPWTQECLWVTAMPWHLWTRRWSLPGLPGCPCLPPRDWQTGKLWNTPELWPSLDWTVHWTTLHAQKCLKWDGCRLTHLKLQGDFRQESSYYWKLSWNLTVTIVLTSLMQCYGNANSSQVWKLKSVDGKNPVAQGHNPSFSPEKQSCVP